MQERILGLRIFIACGFLMKIDEFDAIRFCSDYNIEYWLSGKNVSEGWVSIQCPHCNDDSNHGAINPFGGYFSCWKCGWHSLYDTIKLLVGGVNPLHILKEYGVVTSITKKEKVAGTKDFYLPGGKLLEPHKKYLESRRFDPEFIEEKYSVRGTLMHSQYGYRIITPVIYKGEIVSFLGRDYTNKQVQRHKDCPVEVSKIYHKNILYGLDNCFKDNVLVVEGAYDKWRMGDQCCATLGTGWTPSQANLLADNYNTIFIMFDAGEEAQKKAKGLALYLTSMGKDVELINTEYDEPDDMVESDVNYLKKELKLL